MYFLGVDGGGTKTRYILIDAVGNILSETVNDSIHLLQIGIDDFQENIKSGLHKVCHEAGITMAEINYTFFGIPGYGDEIRDEKIALLKSMLAEILGSEQFQCGNDVEAGWAGSLACQPGINLVAGTGAIGFGKDDQGNQARSSGWGYFYGDEGSAFWLGKQLISYFTKEADGRVTKTTLYKIVKDYFQVANDFVLLDTLYDKYQLDRKKIASLAKLVYQAALAGDDIALNLYDRAAYEHSLTVKAIIERLQFKENSVIKVSYSGGVFRAGKLIIDPFENYLRESSYHIQLIKPLLDPAVGAALYAKLIYQDKQSYEKQVLKNLQADSEGRSS